MPSFRRASSQGKPDRFFPGVGGRTQAALPCQGCGSSDRFSQTLAQAHTCPHGTDRSGEAGPAQDEALRSKRSENLGHAVHLVVDFVLRDSRVPQQQSAPL